MLYRIQGINCLIASIIKYIVKSKKHKERERAGLNAYSTVT